MKSHHILICTIEPEPHFKAFVSQETNSTVANMSLRDYFAAAALNSAYQGAMILARSRNSITDLPVTVAELAYQLADVMLKERNKTK